MAGNSSGATLAATLAAAPLKGIVLAAVTPFARSGGIDNDCFATVLSFLAEHRPSAVAVAMDVGEGISLRDSERKSVTEFAVRAVNGRTKVIADISMAGTKLASDLARHAEASGADAVLATTPYYWRPPERELIEHFSQIAASTSLPVLLHNSPRTHKQHMHDMRFTPAILAEIFDRAPNVVGLVDGSLNLVYFTSIRRFTSEKRPGFLLFTDEAYLTSSMALRGDGAVSYLGGVVPEMIRELQMKCARGQFVEARGLQHAIGRVSRLMRSGSLPGNVKGAMALMARPVGEPRLPNLPVDEAGADQMRKDFEEIGIFGRSRAGWHRSRLAQTA